MKTKILFLRALTNAVVGLIVISTMATATTAFAAQINSVPFDSHFSKATWASGQIFHSYREPMLLRNWSTQSVEEAKALKLYPSYEEPVRVFEDSGMIKKELEGQDIFIARSTFAIDKAPASVNISALLSIQSLNELEALAVPKAVKEGSGPRRIEHTAINSQLLYKDRKTNNPHNIPPGGSWCQKANSVCIQSEWPYPLKFKAAMYAENLTRRSDDKKDFKQVTQSELVVMNGQELSQLPGLKYLVPNLPIVAGVSHSVFYINQLFRWGKNLIILQADPGNPNRTLVTTYSVLSISHRYYGKKVPIFGFTIGDVLMGRIANLKSNDGSLDSGLIDYSANMANTFWQFLSR